MCVGRDGHINIGPKCHGDLSSHYDVFSVGNIDLMQCCNGQKGQSPVLRLLILISIAMQVMMVRLNIVLMVKLTRKVRKCAEAGNFNPVCSAGQERQDRTYQVYCWSY